MSNLSEVQIADLKESFETFDRDSNGCISRTELRSLLHIVGHRVNTNGLDKLLTEYDTDESKTIDFEEFLKLSNTLMKNRVPQ
ncbi:hypothetical protein BGZ76_011842 [Entomortierella beljakovae]|nr:hypothetical protein BGZ76_011842 [Entomortierella beljakovae]